MTNMNSRVYILVFETNEGISMRRVVSTGKLRAATAEIPPGSTGGEAIPANIKDYPLFAGMIDKPAFAYCCNQHFRVGQYVHE